MQRKFLPTVTIGIPAFNEEANIGELITCLLKQKLNNVTLTNIIIRSDGSTDKTEEIVRKFKSKKIKLMTGKRLGLAGNQNEIIKKVTTDYLILLNGDILPKNSNFVSDVLAQAIKETTDLGGIKCVPTTPITFVEKVLNFSVMYKDNVYGKLAGGDNWYTCRGAARIFSKKFYKTFKFKDGINEDSYSYLFCKSGGFKYSFIKSTEIFYKLPETVQDHVKQGVRYFSSVNSLRNDFGKDFLQATYAWPYGSFLFEGVKAFFTNPVLTVGYLGLLGYTKIAQLFTRHESKGFWQTSASTRKVAIL